MRLTRFAALLAVLALGLAACGNDDDDSAADVVADATNETAGAGDGGADTSVLDEVAVDTTAGAGDASVGAGAKGSLVFGDETIAFTSSRCYLQEQDAAAGGGKILFVAQASGTDASGAPVSIDVSRYDEDSQFSGDEIIVDVGDPRSADAVSWSASEETGTVELDGSTMRADELTFVNDDGSSERAGSFEIRC